MLGGKQVQYLLPKQATGYTPDNFQRTVADLAKWSNLAFYNALSSRGIPVGHSIIPVAYRSSFEALLAANKPLPHLSPPHDLRHTAGTIMLRKGVPVEVVSKMLGHADISITYKVYRHVLESERREHVIAFFPNGGNN